MKNIQLTFCAYFILFSSSMFSQTEEILSRHEQVNKFVEELIDKKTDSICDYEVFSENNRPMYAQYVFWKENGKTKVRKLSNRENYPTIEIQADEIWKNIYAYGNTIKNENVKSFSYSERKKGKENIRQVVSEAGEIKEFNLYLSKNIIKFWTSDFDFQKTEEIDGRIRNNIYFEHNNNLKSKLLIDLFNRTVTNLEKTNSFK